MICDVIYSHSVSIVMADTCPEVLDISRSLERHGAIIGLPCNKVPYRSSLGISRTTQPWYSDDNLRYPPTCSGSFALGSFSPTYRDLLPGRAKRETANRRYFRANRYRKEAAFLVSLSHRLKGKDAPDIRYNISTRNAYQLMLFFAPVRTLSSK